MKNHCSKLLVVAVLGAVILGIMSQSASAGVRSTVVVPPPTGGGGTVISGI